MPKLDLVILKEKFAICQLTPKDPIPDLTLLGDFWSITKTNEEISIIVPEKLVPLKCKTERGWRAIKIIGPLYFSLTGIIASLSTVLAKAGISIFAFSTYNTDYILVKEKNLELSKQFLKENGHNLIELH
ncbi:MAG: ACT domain-containing protein [Promethearchaeia archaeon]|nr:MAG: ACT domain-containing protein [Candidatus Lokiarchaeia archaeon]